MDYAEAIEAVKALEIEGKDDIVAGIQEGIASRNKEAETSREALKVAEGKLGEMDSLKATMGALTDTISKVSGKQVDPSSNVDMLALSNQLTTMKTDMETFKAERDTAKAERDTEKAAKDRSNLSNSIMKELSNAMPESKDDTVELLLNRFKQDSNGEFFDKAGKSVSDSVRIYLEANEHLVQSNITPGAGLRKAPGGNDTDASSPANRIKNALGKM
jgi:hypothetical protein